jgi:hypothetical protein
MIRTCVIEWSPTRYSRAGSPDSGRRAAAVRNVQLMKRIGVSSDDRTVFICDQCNQFAADLHRMQDDIYGDDQSPHGDRGASPVVTGNIRWARANDSS